MRSRDPISPPRKTHYRFGAPPVAFPPAILATARPLEEMSATNRSAIRAAPDCYETARAAGTRSEFHQQTVLRHLSRLEAPRPFEPYPEIARFALTGCGSRADSNLRRREKCRRR